MTRVLVAYALGLKELRMLRFVYVYDWMLGDILRDPTAILAENLHEASGGNTSTNISIPLGKFFPTYRIRLSTHASQYIDNQPQQTNIAHRYSSR